ncbi:MAG: bifunctional heptose 7-phosphate kinase/heptose 1-phosphate adenyltransferase [archaeon]|jgi:D-beta-D-heptose 7-phosphate kinase/D-beta-D-heptose 1-phosphate adenosyltransferase|nr:bifunctional heptose 7-phosphate kinase/heptose 1-phosphate adenyltransferase [archaeon]
MEKISQILDNFKNAKVVVVGDVMLDKYIMGKAGRVSPEAPVLVFSPQSEKFVPGGAANVACNIAEMGGSVSLFGAIGNDKEGDMIKEALKEKSVRFFPTHIGKTTTKVRLASGTHQILRIDYEETSTKDIDNELFLEEEAKNADVIVVSDYAKGIITSHLMNKLKSFGKKVIVDPKPKNSNLYHGVHLIKLNEGEALAMANLNDVYLAGRILRERFGSNIIVTRGSKGMILFENVEKEFPSMSQEVYDVTGAGDTVISTIALALAAGADLEYAALLSTYAAGIVVGKFGTATLNEHELERKIFQEESKLKTREELKKIVTELKKRGKKIVWTNGCFDLLHDSHVKTLRKAKSLGDVLIVGLNTDESVRRVKGPGRPVRNEKARAEVISSLGCVDYVILYNETSPVALLDELAPDIYTKGSDSARALETKDSEEAKVIEKHGGKVVLIPIDSSVSTTKIIESVGGEEEAKKL